MAEAAVTFLLDNVQKLLVEQMHLISGAEKELKQLQIELELMNAFLMEYADKREKGRVFIQFERQIREAVYDAEDILDACLTQKAQSGATTIRNFMHLHDLAEKVNELRLQLQPIFDRTIKGLNALPIAHPSAATPDDNKFKKTQLLREDNVVGFADEEATLMKYLKEKTEQLDVISIVGMPGLGKTTLAWKIYRDPKIQFEFPTLIWVYVSQELNVREVFLTILKHFTRNDMSGKGEWELTQLVRSHLDKGRFLLFMDDVWSVEDWRRIEAALPKSNKLGKVLITSRHVGVATQTNSSRKPHRLRFMTFEESWELLQLEVFGKNNPSPKELEALGMHIARQCSTRPSRRSSSAAASASIPTCRNSSAGSREAPGSARSSVSPRKRSRCCRSIPRRSPTPSICSALSTPLRSSSPNSPQAHQADSSEVHPGTEPGI